MIGRLRAIRADTSQRAFARQLGVAPQLVQRAEQLGTFALELLLAIGESGVRLNWLMLGEGPATWAKRGLRPSWERSLEVVKASRSYL